jgi:hypothetical protein
MRVIHYFGSSLAEEPTALIAHGGVCEGGGRDHE